MATYSLQVNGQDSKVDIDDPSTPLLLVFAGKLSTERPQIRLRTRPMRGMNRAARRNTYPLLHHGRRRRRWAQRDVP